MIWGIDGEEFWGMAVRTAAQGSIGPSPPQIDSPLPAAPAPKELP